tara:strand:+ start:318 stop:452 length:135 start_codon:yes stop_codon:yes gene_type:complete
MRKKLSKLKKYAVYIFSASNAKNKLEQKQKIPESIKTSARLVAI